MGLSNEKTTNSEKRSSPYEARRAQLLKISPALNRNLKFINVTTTDATAP
jgi:hypothetical protein